MDKVYVWTKKAEEQANRLGLETKLEGDPAYCGYKPIGGSTLKAWLDKGFVKELEE